MIQSLLNCKKAEFANHHARYFWKSLLATIFSFYPGKSFLLPRSSARARTHCCKCDIIFHGVEQEPGHTAVSVILSRSLISDSTWPWNAAGTCQRNPPRNSQPHCPWNQERPQSTDFMIFSRDQNIWMGNGFCFLFFLNEGNAS